jgi:hypothetical protein
MQVAVCGPDLHAFRTRKERLDPDREVAVVWDVATELFRDLVEQMRFVWVTVRGHGNDFTWSLSSLRLLELCMLIGTQIEIHPATTGTHCVLNRLFTSRVAHPATTPDKLQTTLSSVIAAAVLFSKQPSIRFKQTLEIPRALYTPSFAVSFGLSVHKIPFLEMPPN